MACVPARFKVKNYYLLCSVGTGKVGHIASQMSKKDMSMIFSRNEQDAYFRLKDGQYISRERIVGGVDQAGLSGAAPITSV